MSNAIWLIMYDVAVQDVEPYLEWFHDVHIPEKLARPGYTWAANYELITADGGPAVLSGAAASDDRRGYAAFFGGEDTRTFLNPSPAQIKPNQPPLTREMMARRIGSQSLIAAEEWRGESPDVSSPTYAFLEIVTCDTGGHDEDYGAWTIQSLYPYLQEAQGFEVMAKLVSTTTATKHVTVSSFATLADLQAQRRDAPKDEWSVRVRDYQDHGGRPPMLGRRLWPLA